jgi:multiple sugar transport system ATP-binding protein
MDVLWSLMAEIRFDNATLTYPGNERPAVDHLELSIADGEFLVLVGPSGCGKTTALRMVAGLEEVDGGRVFIGGRDVTDLPPKERNIAMVFQNYALYPHLTVAQNMGFALQLAHVPKAEIRQRVEEAARTLDLTEFLSRKPNALSGGQRQRVAMGRAIVRNPQAFLMDEPLSNLDAKLRVQTRAQIAELQRRLGVTTLYVTHDQVEAMTMGDRVAVLRDGVLQQVDVPKAIYDKPVNEFVAGFMGSPPMNLIEVRLTSDTSAAFGEYELQLPFSIKAFAAGSRKVVVGIRPGQWRSVESGQGVAVHVLVVEELGSDAYIHGTAEIDGHQVPLVIQDREGPIPAKGSVLHLAPVETELHLFSPDSGARLEPA